MTKENIISKLYLKKAYEYAAANSTDPSTQNGAIIINWALKGDPNPVPSEYVQTQMLHSIEIGIGANHFPRGVEEKAERWERPAKYSFIEHAERNAIFDAVKKGNSTEGAVMYACWFACADCGRAIIQSGIKEVIGHDGEHHKSRPDWSKSIEIADQMFKEAGVKFTRIKAHFGIKIRFNGEIVEV